ncbi:MAG: mandelate racemase [Actinoallomurus sp.]|nr:mandelate racemase [Actinoallomurus sp.]
MAVAGRPSVRVLVKVSADGVHGWGEATPIPAWTYETAESIVTTIDRYLAPAILGRPVWDLDGVTTVFDRAINRGFSIGAPLAKCAVDVALHDLHDLLGRAAGVPVGVLWGQRRAEEIQLAWIVSGQTAGEVADCVAEGARGRLPGVQSQDRAPRRGDRPGRRGGRTGRGSRGAAVGGRQPGLHL